MSEPENFIARGSRRKREAAQETEAEKPAAAPEAAPESAPDDDQRVGNAPPLARGDASEPPQSVFDPKNLPPIETITAESDIRAFLAPGVPAELTRAALRRAWAADPKIRDFVGLADYDWDFNAPGSMAGFGPLEMTEELRQIAARIIGQSPLAKPDTPVGSDSSGQIDPHGERLAVVHDRAEKDPDVAEPPSEPDPHLAAAQNLSDATEKSQLVVGPRHGGALPK